jgi:putative molybdenum carrier protein
VDEKRAASGLRRVISGGQTGVDQAALEAAEACGLDIGGWCPPGRASEAGPIPERWPLRETPVERSRDAPDVPRSLRTEWNVRDADGTLILAAAGDAARDRGSAWAAECARRYGRPLLVCDPDEPAAADRIVDWLCAHAIETLGVGGPSERTEPGVGGAAYTLLVAVFRRLSVR